MSTAATQLHFAAECALFLVTVAGLVLALRPGLLGADRAARALFAAGFATLAVVAFLAGSFLVGSEDGDDPGLLALRIGGSALVALGALRWAGDQLGRFLLWVGLAGVVVAAVLGLDGPSSVADVVQSVGAVGVGTALVVAGRRSLPARIGTSAAGLLLVVVLAISLTQSVVLTRNVEQEALRRYGSRCTDEARAAAGLGRESLATARLLGGILAANADSAAALEVVSSTGATELERATAREGLQRSLVLLASDEAFGVTDPLAYVAPSGVPEAASPASLDNATRLALAGNAVVLEAVEAQGARQSVTVVGGRGYAVGAVPVRIRPDGAAEVFAGVVVVALRLDDSYLRVQTGGERLSLALVTSSAVLARSGPQPARSDLLSLGRRVVDGDQRPSSTVGERFVVARPVAAEGTFPQMALVTSAPTASVLDARDALLRSLFLVALGAALVAVGLAVFAGERIGGGLRRLTGAAERIRAGDLDARASVDREDELGTLGSTFDAMAGSLRSMTGDLRRAADDEARLRGRLETVIAGMGEALVAEDAQGRVSDCNRAAEELLGRTAAEVIGRPLAEVVRFTPADRTTAEPVEVPDTGVMAADGTVAGVDGAVPVVVTAAALHEPDGGRAGSVLVLRDVRQERDAERMKTEFLANIGHELRSPLTPIKGYAGVLARQPLDREQAARFAAQIGAGVDQLERVIGQLVNFATVAAGRLELRPEPVPVWELVDGAVHRWRERTGPDGGIARRASPRLPTVVVDRRHLDQAIDELVDNAVKYSPAGSRVVISAALCADERSSPDGAGGSVRLSVTDQGVGIDPRRLDHLVTEFAQGDGSATRRFGGLGLGLAFADRIVRAHGGTLTCTSTAGSGAIFSIVLPLPSVPVTADGGP